MALRSIPGASWPVRRKVEPSPPWQLPLPNGRKSWMHGLAISVPSPWNTKVRPNWASALALPGSASPLHAIARGRLRRGHANYRVEDRPGNVRKLELVAAAERSGLAVAVGEPERLLLGI